MLRVYRPFRTLFRSPRLLSRIPNGQTVRIERVKIKKAKPIARVLGATIKGFLVLELVLWTFLPFPESSDEPRPQSQTSPRFIPFPFTTKQLPRQPYPPGCPEYQEFKRISRDIEKKKAIMELAKLTILKEANTSSQLKRLLNFEPGVQITEHTLRITFPTFAPPVFVRSGILVKADSLEWATQPIDQAVKRRLDRILWPDIALYGLYAVTVEAFKSALDEVRRARSASGDPASPAPHPGPTAPAPEMQKILERMRQGSTSRPHQAGDPGPAGPSPSRPTTASDSSNNSERKKPDIMWYLKNSHETHWQRFRGAIVRGHLGGTIWPPRGCVLIAGHVRLESSNYYVTMDATLHYNPKTESIDYPSSRFEVKTYGSNRF